MGIATTYSTFFNYFFLVISLILVGISVYFIIDNTSTLSKAMVGVSAFYFLVAASGIVSRFLNFGYMVFLGMIALVTIFQAAILVLITFVQDKTMEKLRELDGSDYDKARTAYEFIEDNTAVCQIVLLATIVIYLGAFLAAYYLKTRKASPQHMEPANTVNSIV